MKTGMLVGAVGLALAAGAQAERFGTVAPAMAPNGAGAADVTVANGDNTTPMDAREFRRERNKAVGGPNSALRRQVAAELQEQVDSGQLDPRRVLLSGVGVNDRKFSKGETDNPLDEVGFRNLVENDPAVSGLRGPGGDLVPPFAYFDGFETYNIDPDPNDSSFAPGISGQINPDGRPWPFAQFWYNVVDQSQVLVDDINNPGMTFPLPPSRNPFNPGGVGNYPVDRDPAVEQVFAIDRGNTAGGDGTPIAVPGFFLGARTEHRTFIPDASSTTTDPGGVIYSVDYYFSDAETLGWHDGVSRLEGFISARYFFFGYDFSSSFGPFVEPNGQAQRPIVLGTLPGNFTIGQFYATPESPATGLPTFRAKTREWFSAAVRMSNGDLQMWMRDSSTDGSGSILIDDPRDIELFESGWAEIYPGQEAVETAPGVFTGVGRAVNEFGNTAPQPAPLLAGVSHANLDWVLGGDPIPPNPTVSGWEPTNFWADNYIVVGNEFELPAPPKFRIPYKDDIERYEGNAPLALQTDAIWFDALSSRAAIVTNVNGTTANPASDGGAPEQSIRQRNTFVDSIHREEFSTNLPGFDEETADQRPFAAPGNPVELSALVRLNNTTTGRGIYADDNDFTSTFRTLILGARNANGASDAAVYVRQPNPLFDPDAEVDPSTADEQPELTIGEGKNVTNVNYPTTMGVSALGVIGSFAEAKITIYSGGYAQWTVGGTPVTFNEARINDLDPSGELLQTLMDADMLAGGDGTGPFSHFLWEANTVDDFEFWSSNNVTGQFGTIWVDDVCLDALVFDPGLGPALELPYYDKFDLYQANARIDNQGDTPFIAANSLQDTSLNIILDNIEVTADTDFAGMADFCVYNVNEVILRDDREGNQIPDEFGLMANDKIYVQVPSVSGFTCPEVVKKSGEFNFVLFEDPDVMDGRVATTVAASLDGLVTADDGSAAAAIGNFDRYRADRLFCRYELSAPLEALPDPMGGDFDCPDWQAGDIIAIDSVFAEDEDSMTTPCPGVVGGPGDLTILDRNEECEICEGEWTLVSTCMVDDGEGGMEEVACAELPADSDIRGYAFDADGIPRWDGTSAGGSNGFVLDAADIVDPVTDMPIDGAAEFGNVLQMLNNGSIAGSTEDGTVFADAGALLVSLGADAEDETTINLFFDVYVQDTNSRLEMGIGGTGGQLTGFRFGGPDQVDFVPDGNLAIEIPDMSGTADSIWSDTGFPMPTNEWVRFGLSVNSLGEFQIGVDTSGTPGGANGAMMADCFEDYTIIVSDGMAIDTDDDADGDGLPVNNITSIAFAQGFDEGGDGGQFFDATEIQAQAPDAIAMPGDPGSGGGDPTTNGYCFYEIFSVTVPAGQTAPDVQPIDAQTGLVDGGPRAVAAGDVVAVPFDMTGSFYDNCPNNPNPAGLEFNFVDGMGTVVAEGFWTILGTRNQAGVNDPIPATGISDPDGIMNGQAYNFNATFVGEPARTILISDLVSFDTVPERVPASQWWFDNLHIKQRGGAPPCPEDLANNDGIVGAADLAQLLGNWGGTGPADFDGSGAVGSADLGQLLGSWGPCPTGDPCP